MKEFWVFLTLALIMASWGGMGYDDFGTSPAFADPPYSQYRYYNFRRYCADPYNYYNCYSTPYRNPGLGYFYYYTYPFGRPLPPQYRRDWQQRRFHRHQQRQYRRFHR